MQEELEKKLLIIIDKLSFLELQMKEIREMFKDASEQRIKHNFTHDGEIMFRHRNIKETEL